MTAIQVAARAAYTAGLCIVPPLEDGSKRPLAAWKAYQASPPPREQCGEWWGPRTGLGVVCGAVSGGLEVLDFDDRPAYDDYVETATRAGLGELVSRIEAGYVEDTPSGGVHWLYCCAEIAGNTKLASRLKRPEERRDEDDKIKTKIETRAEGGFCILAPSNGRVHPSGKPYVLRGGSFATIPTVTPEERRELHRLARTLDELPTVLRDSRGQTDAAQAGGRPGDEFNARAQWSDVLTPHGWQEAYTRGDVTYWRRPGKDTPGISATTNHAGSGLLYVFSSSTVFEAERGYSKFSAHAVLNHGGDFSAAAKALVAQGYGTPTTSGGGRANTRVTPAEPEWPREMGEAAFHGPIGRLVRTVAPHTEADPAGLLLQALIMFGSVIGRHVYFVAESARHYPVLFGVLVGLSAKSRKGSSFATVKAPMLLVDPDLDKPGRIEKGLSSGEGLVWAVRDPQAARDGTMSDGVTDKRCLVVESEFANTLKVMARDGNTLSPLLREAWDGNSLGTLTKNNRATATGAHISLIGHITRDELRRYLDATEAGNGFGNRILWCCVRRARVLPDGGALHTVDLHALAEPLQRAVRLTMEPHKVIRDTEASRLWGKCTRN